MKEPEESEIYNLFKVRLNNADQDLFSDDSWDKMEQLLDEKPAKKTAVIWLYRVSAGIAAALLLFTTFYFLRPANPVDHKIAKSPGNLLKPDVGESNISKRQEETSTVHQNERLRPGLFSLLAKQSSKENGRHMVQAQFSTLTRDSSSANNISLVDNNLTVSGSKKISADTISSLLVETLPATDALMTANPDTRIGKIRMTTPSFPRQFTLSVLAAPDVNNANRISNGGQVGTNFGMQFSMQLSKRISVSSGAFYSTKPYQIGSVDYKPQTPNWWASRFGSMGKPDQVVANCKVLDIPLNVNYLLFSKANNKLTIGSGLSSYFMLSEAYHFNFADPSIKAPDFDISNRNQHILGLINLNATYERRVNNRFGIVVQPYLKLPITQIGFGQVGLRSTGVAAGLSWNINSAKAK